MSIATRIENMTNNLENAYNNIEDLGIDLTNINKNLENLSTVLEEVYENYPKISGTGTDITLNNTAKGKMKIDLKGNTSQVQLEGKNLAYRGWAEDFVSRINNSNLASLIINGGRNCLLYSPQAGYGDYENKYIFKTDFEENTQYTFQFDIKKQTSNTPTFAIEYTDGTSTLIPNVTAINTWQHITLTSTAGKTIKYARANYTDGGTFIDLNTFMVEEGSTATSYEPYCGGISSPNPDFPQQIKNVTGNANVKIQNKNLAWTGWAEDCVSRMNLDVLAKIVTKDDRNCLCFAASAGYGDYAHKYIFKTEFKENTQYTFAFDILSTTSNFSNYNMTIYYTDGTNTPIVIVPNNNWNKFVITSTPNKTIKYITPYYTSGARYIDLDTFMVLEGAYTAQTIPEYVPHQEQNYPFTLGNIELNKIGTSQDYFFKNVVGSKYYNSELIVNKWYLHKEIKKGTITSISSTGTATSGIKYASIGTISDSKSDSFVYCQNYINGTDASKDNRIRFAVNMLFIYDNRITDKETALELLNGLEYYYRLKTPTNEEITDTTLINQLEAIYNTAKSYKEQTYISTITEDNNVAPILDATALLDSNL